MTLGYLLPERRRDRYAVRAAFLAFAQGAWAVSRGATKRLPCPRDPLALAKLIGDIATGQVADARNDGKEEGAAAMGQKGAKQAASSRSAEIARRAAEERWQVAGMGKYGNGQAGSNRPSGCKATRADGGHRIA